MKEIKITQGKIVTVSDMDYEELIKFNWSYSASTGYAVRKGRKSLNEPRTVHMHRFIMDASSKVQIDHINGNKLDNRRLNLRIASVQKNAFNRKKPKVECTSIYKGVLQRKNSEKWIARIKINNKAIHLGTLLMKWMQQKPIMKRPYIILVSLLDAITFWKVVINIRIL